MEGNSVVQSIRQWPAEVKSYILDLQGEMRKVTWPPRRQVEGTTLVVIVTVFAFAAYFAVVDAVFTRGVAKMFTIFAKH